MDLVMKSSRQDLKKLTIEESLFHLANGYVGIRGYFGEMADAGLPGSVRGVYLNGFYENVPLQYAEEHAGYPLQGERMVSLPDIKSFSVTVAGATVSPLHPDVSDYDRELDMAGGIASYRYTYRRDKGDMFAVDVTEMLSLTRRNVFVQTVTLSSGYKPLDLTLSAGMARRKEADYAEKDPRVASAAVPLDETFSLSAEDEMMLYRAKAVRSGHAAAVASRFFVSTLAGTVKIASEPVEKDNYSGCEYQMALSPDSKVRLTRIVGFADSRRDESPLTAARTAVNTAEKDGLHVLLNEQRALLESFWSDHRVMVAGDEKTQNALDFAVFSLLQSAPDDGISLIPAKGLSGEGYEGHYFWDFEIYLFPFFLWTWPKRAKSLLDYRLRTLEKAKLNAKVLGYEKGAQYAWRTISGQECSGYFPAGSAQVHINADIAHTFALYYDVTGDLDYLADGGVDVLIETARTWLEIGGRQDGRFVIPGVTGPDEYSCLVDNNWYTNRAAAKNLRDAVRLVNVLSACGRTGYVERTGVTSQELADFSRAAECMYLPHDQELGIDAQDDGFLRLLPWDIAGTPKDNFPLLLHYHPSKLYRYQVLKQPDTTLAHFLFETTPLSATVTRSRHYYEVRTTHDSSLSACIYGAMAALSGETRKASAYFRQSRDIDLENLQGNTADGLHLGNLGGLWMFAVQGYAGLRLDDGMISLAPRLHPDWESLAFTIYFRQERLDISFGKVSCTFLWHGYDVLVLKFRGRLLSLPPGKQVTERFYRGIIFDLDGVLIHTDHFHYLAWKEMADREGIFFDEAVNERLRGVSRIDSLEIILEKAAKPYCDAEKAEMMDAKNRRYLELLGGLSKASISEGVRDGLAALRNAGYALAVASSSKNAGTILRQLELEDTFDVITDGTNVRLAKPDPAVFLITAEKLGLAPSDLIVVEDAKAGLEAARAGGFTAAGFGAAARSALAELSFQNPDELFVLFSDTDKEVGHGRHFSR